MRVNHVVGHRIRARLREFDQDDLDDVAAIGCRRIEPLNARIG
jgi:hypothetical protein